MKKITILLLFVIFGLTNVSYSQEFEVLHVGNFHIRWYCTSDENLAGVIVYGEENCNNQSWFVTINHGYGETVFLEDYGVDSIVIPNPHTPNDFAEYTVYYNGCDISCEGVVGFFISFTDENPFTESVIWKHKNGSITLDANPNYMDWSSLWSTGEITETIEVSEPGTYSVTITDDCGSATYSIEVRDNVELYRATCDLVTNRNQLTWQVTEAQAQYVSAVKVYRNSTELVATVPYTDGAFTDNIGSEATQWQYHIVAVDSDGNDCPIPSRWKRTIHLDRVQGAQGNQILQWTPYEEESPTKETVEAYGIYDIVNGEARHVIDVGSFTNVYAYNPADFMGYGAVAAKFAENKGFETLAFSNHTIVPLDVEENKTSIFTVYPNPSDGRFTVEGTGRLTITNVLGQTVLTRDITDTETIELPMGVWFVKLDGTTRKVVVE